jgi:hypothetical protein
MLSVTSLALTPPAVKDNFCTSLDQFVTVNGTKQQDESFTLCLDYPKWTRIEDSQGIHQVFNGTHRFDLSKNAKSPGGFDCVVTGFGKPPKQAMPFSFIQIDPAATFNQTVSDLDGFASAQEWSKAITLPTGPGRMDWYVENTTAPPSEFLRTAATQTPPGGGVSVGTRDFSKDFTSPAPAGTFEPPAGVKCTDGGGSGGMVPSTGCAPACGTGALCCMDKGASPPGTCYTCDDCSEVHGATPPLGAAWKSAGPAFGW